jgi:hypothetical protein
VATFYFQMLKIEPLKIQDDRYKILKNDVYSQPLRQSQDHLRPIQVSILLKEKYYPGQAVGPDKQYIRYTFAYHIDNDPRAQPVHVPFENEESWDKLKRQILVANDGLEHQRIRKFIIQDFPGIIKKITDNFTSTIWATFNTFPLLTISELLWLKVDDVDSRVDHLEKMLAQVIDDNKLLQRKVDALEQQKRIKDAKFKRLLIQELD